MSSFREVVASPPDSPWAIGRSLGPDVACSSSTVGLPDGSPEVSVGPVGRREGGREGGREVIR